MSKEKVRVIVGVPIERSVPGAVFWNFMSISNFGYPFIPITNPETGDSETVRIDIARNIFALHLLNNKEFTHLVMLDMDHKHPQHIVAHLAARVREDPNKKVISALYFNRRPPFNSNAFMIDDKGYFSPVTDWERGLYKVDALGGAAMIISREVFETIPPPWFRFTYSLKNPGRGFDGNGEDIWFSKKCKKHGIQMWLDTTIEAPHLIDGWITESVYRQYKASHPILFEEEEAPADNAGQGG